MKTLTPSGQFTTSHGLRTYTIDQYHAMDPFMMTLAGASDVWLFVSSTGGLTAGRRNSEHALFPYDTDDRVADSSVHTGGFTVLNVSTPDGVVAWEPFGATIAEGSTRSISKSVLGEVITFSETNTALGLRFSYAWQSSQRYGIVRHCAMTNLYAEERSVGVVDGLMNFLPPGASVQVTRNLSNLLDAYKVTEIDLTTGLCTGFLNSRLTDLAEPAESLAATTVWQCGLTPTARDTSTRNLTRLRAGEPLDDNPRSRGERAAYLIGAEVSLEADGDKEWFVVADVDQDAADVVALREALRHPDDLALSLREELAADRSRLRSLVASADGLQCTGEEEATAHHQSNVLYNIMRGGVFADGYRLDADDLLAFLRQRNAVLADTLGEELRAKVQDHPSLHDVRQWAAQQEDNPDLVRLLGEYMPLTFSRRHGDPTRPWNRFDIVVTGDDGEPVLDHQGNWRDIFQNWEALSWSYPRYLSSMIATFANATTVDGYNPYRISRAGIDWEVPDPDDPWANIGYWSDHQIVYLLALLETAAAFEPGSVESMLDDRVFSTADVPYRLAGFDQMTRDASSTITFDDEAHALAQERAAHIGGDGLLRHDASGAVTHSTLAEKLLLLLCAKLVNLVPGGGLWMNTQRPEWNDANNALVGRGLSVVTVAYLHRYITHLQALLVGAEGDRQAKDLDADADLAALVLDLTGILAGAERAGILAGAERAGSEPGDDASRRAIVEELGRAGEQYRTAVYADVSGQRTTLTPDQVAALLDAALRHTDEIVRSNQREDGLFHGYNTMTITPEAAHVHRLPVMLEGQVAVLGSGILDADETVALLTALRQSALYREDQHSYQLYPDADVPTFLDRNLIPASASSLALLDALDQAGHRRIAVRDIVGDWHFGADLRHAKDLDAELDLLAGDPRFAELVESDRGVLLDAFEEVFDHASFTGRSGSFFAYEGLGSIYWHMVAKLLLGTQRAALNMDHGAELLGFYEDIRQGIGYCKSPAEYGAFPTEPYSHTPGGRGARQPGMTGQVKEEVITRFAELGVRVIDGQIVVDARLARESEWLPDETAFAYLDVNGDESTLTLPAGTLAFTWCQVPFVMHRAPGPGVRVTRADGSSSESDVPRLSVEVSAEIFGRLGTIARIDAYLG